MINPIWCNLFCKPTFWIAPGRTDRRKRVHLSDIDSKIDQGKRDHNQFATVVDTATTPA
jgi:hypothetical protein